MKLLKDLYYIYSPSGYEQKMSEFIQKYLDSLNIKYKVDGNIIYSLKKNTLLLCAHQDQVSNYPIQKIRMHNNIIYADGNLGADDKNGIWITLKLLKEFPETSFIFSDKEEVGGNIDKLLFKYQTLLSEMLYCLVFDRKGSSDIICNDNTYGSPEFEYDLEKIGKKFRYKPSQGLWSDCDILSEYISCCNLSCGYYNAHSKTEYTKFNELNNALLYGKEILNTLTKQYEPPIKYNDTFKDSWKHDEFDKYYLYCKVCDEYFSDDDLSKYDMKSYCPYCGSDLYEEDFDDNIENYELVPNTLWDEL